MHGQAIRCTRTWIHIQVTHAPIAKLSLASLNNPVWTSSYSYPEWFSIPGVETLSYKTHPVGAMWARSGTMACARSEPHFLGHYKHGQHGRNHICRYIVITNVPVEILKVVRLSSLGSPRRAHKMLQTQGAVPTNEAISTKRLLNSLEVHWT